MLKLKLQYFGHLMGRADSLEKTLMLGKVKGGRRGRQRMRWLDGITDQWRWVWVNSGSWWWPGRPGLLYCVGSQRVGHNWATKLNWTDVNFYSPVIKWVECVSFLFLVTNINKYVLIRLFNRLSEYLLATWHFFLTIPQSEWCFILYKMFPYMSCILSYTWYVWYCKILILILYYDM